MTVDGDPESGIRQMNEVTDYINQLLQDCQAKAQEAFVAKKIRNKLETEVDQLRSSTHLLRNRVTNMVEQARQASQRRRIREHLKCYIEMLTHRRARLEINVEKLHKKNENLCEQREKYTAERLDLRNTITTLRGFEKLDSC